MKRIVITGSVVAAGIAMTTGFAAWGAQPAATEPWTAVPAAPAGCYQSDKYADKVQAAIDSVSAAESQQKAINDEIQSRVSNVSERDPMEMARRMQEALMRDPQHAQQAVQQMTAGAAGASPGAVTEEGTRILNREKQLLAEGRRLEGQYKSALHAALAPARARFVALAKRADAQAIRGEGGDVWPDWANKELDGILRDSDRVYEATCPQWFGPSGQLSGYLARYKEFLVNERVPYYRKTVDEPNVANYSMLNIPATGYRSTAPHDAVHDYLKEAGDVYNRRQAQPSCVSGACQDWLGVESRDR